MGVGISLEVDCAVDVRCGSMAWALLDQLDSGKYDRCAVLPIPDAMSEWREDHRTARKRANRAARRGYWCDYIQRDELEDEIHEINTSMAFRQGRPMSEGYTERQSFEPLPDYVCARHRIRTLGVFEPLEGKLCGYMVTYRCGDLVLVSQILGHGEHLENEIMYLLFAWALEGEAGNPGVVVYNRYDSGQDGLRFWKDRTGFEEREVAWLP